MSSIEDYLNEKGTLTYSNVGVSMMPLLRQGRDLFTVRKKGPERCKVGDVVLYKRPPDKYVLHRIVEVRRDSYVILGDSCVNREYGVTDSDILGVMTGYIRDGKEHSVTEQAYLDYTARILRNEKKRVARIRLKLRIRRTLRRMAGRA